ncbi:hypothetical protein PUR28_11690 [Streptomyces sp. BE308]|uniref:hypothetical protein n=1 Tax=Streptomyces sp. BE308 TaxID=3002529 RepID=UPI002E79DE4D|nr:hypothetical protein [Streptomyces sp. BE308]MEE1791424.1 hypothetical protein [Streptomyces sp. BE308]
MTSRARSRVRTQKVPAGATTVRIPRQRGRRAESVVVVVPERPSLTRQALAALGRLLWRFRRSLAPTGLAVLAFALTAILHTVAQWSGLVLAPAAAAPLLWLLITQRRTPATGSDLAWRASLAALAATATAWGALACWFGPLAGALELWWLLTLIGAQTTWLIVRRTH